MQKILGGPMSDSTARDWPALQQSMAGRQVEMPNESAKMGHVMPMGPISKMMYPDAYGVTGPLGTVSLNRELIERDNQNLDDVLSHELHHVGQGPMGLLRQMYGDPNVENSAINREAMRNVRREDIPLPNSGPVDPSIVTRSNQVTQKKFKPEPPDRKWWQSTNDQNTLRPPANITGPRG
jgi:hypothetical protein